MRVTITVAGMLFGVAVAASAPVPARLDGGMLHFANPEYGVAPGQAAVLYDGDRVLGGGWIVETTAALLPAG